MRHVVTLLLPFKLTALIVIGASTASAQAPRQGSTIALEQRLDAIENKLKLLNEYIDNVNARTGDINHARQLSCEASGFFPVQVAGGLSFLVACEKIEPFLEGYRLTLAIGNPYSMQFDGATGTIGYGEDLVSVFRQTTEFTFVSPLVPGNWSRTTIVINRVGAKDVRVIWITRLNLSKAQEIVK
jgi:hypothetical protein